MSLLHSDCFAYRSKRKYPIHTKLATMLSFTLYLNDMLSIPQDACDQINMRFVKAASLHDIKLPNPVPNTPVRLTHLYIDALGNCIRFTKLATITDVLSLNDMLSRQRLRLSFDAMQKLALYGFRVGLLLGAPAHVLDSLQKRAGLGIGDKLAMLNEFIKRASAIMMPMAQQLAFYRIYNSMNTLDLLAMFKKSGQICLTLHNIDKLYNLTDRYGKLLQAPLDVCCSITVDSLLKEASDFLHVKSTDTVLSKSALLSKKDTVDLFLKLHYGFLSKSELDTLNKVASLSKTAITSLILTID